MSIKEPNRINGDGLTEEYGKWFWTWQIMDRLALEFNNLLKNIEKNTNSGAMDALCFPINRSVAIAALEVSGKNHPSILVIPFLSDWH